MLTVAYVYSRWSRSDLRCYVNGVMVSNVEMSWSVPTADAFDKCLIGGFLDMQDNHLFAGRISSIHVFNEALSPQQISAIFKIGHTYQGQFRHESEARGLTSVVERRALYESKVSQSLMFSYSPSACDHNICLDQAPKSATSVFAHSPHALMQGVSFQLLLSREGFLIIFAIYRT